MQAVGGVILIRAYLDTSVIGGLLDDDPPDWKATTQDLFTTLERGTILEPYVSVLVVDEVMQGPERLIEVFRDVLGKVSLQVLERTEESEELADRYLSQGVVSPSQRNDALHLAIATVAGLDVVLSWNFRHMVNLSRIRGINGVNLLAGYRQIDVRSPREVLDEGE